MGKITVLQFSNQSLTDMRETPIPNVCWEAQRQHALNVVLSSITPVLLRSIPVQAYLASPSLGSQLSQALNYCFATCLTCVLSTRRSSVSWYAQPCSFPTRHSRGCRFIGLHGLYRVFW